MKDSECFLTVYPNGTLGASSQSNESTHSELAGSGVVVLNMQLDLGIAVSDLRLIDLSAACIR